jgi:hypothetical protein
MSNQQIQRILFIAIPLLLVLSLIWHPFIPFLSLALLYLAILVFRSIFAPKAIQAAQPTPQPTPLTPGFHLSPEEYQQLSQHYTGYQAQTPPRTQGKHEDQQDAQPKQESPIDFTTPQVLYPDQLSQ